MFSLHVANRTENLLRHLAAILGEKPSRHEDIFAPELFLIQSQGMERMVAQSLATEFGSFCNYQFFLPLDFLGFIAERLKLGITSSGFGRQVLTWRIERLLRDLDGEDYQLLRQYLSGDNLELKRFQLARRLANIFDQYQVNRLEILSQWQDGRRATDHPAEIWQMALWQRLLRESSDDMHRGLLFRRVIDTLCGETDLSRFLPKCISVIGLHTMPPIFLEYLNRLAGHMDIYLFLLSPCRHYWGDMESEKAQLKRLSRQRATDQEMQAAHHPLLVNLGGQGRDFQNMLLDNVDFFEESDSYDEPLDDEDYVAATLLQRIQADLLEDRLPPIEAGPAAAGDDSLIIVSCYSKLRELQVLKDHLLRLLHEDASLALRQIVVMAPDIQEYAVLVPAVFADMQYSIADRSMRRRNSVLAAFLAFLNLFIGRFGWSEVFDLLRRPKVHSQFQLMASDLEVLQQWIIGSGIRWGLSGLQRREEGLADFAETSWRAGLDRLLMGYAVGTEQLVDGIMPYTDIEGRGAQALGGLCQFIEMLEQARLDFQQSRSLVRWSELLVSYGRNMFGDADDQELLELYAILNEPMEALKDYHSEPVGFSVIHEWLKLSAKESRSSSGFLRGQLTFCSMLPMRSIPFNVVCLLGLNDGVFPKNDRHDTFDLMAGDFRSGDRSPRADDRYQFLEALLAARSHLYISYIGQSIRTGDFIPPSNVLSEFVELLNTSYAVRDAVVRHPLHPFSSRYFAGDADESQKYFSYNEYFYRTALVMSKGARPIKEWWQGRIASEETTVYFEDLLRFAAGPQKYFVRRILGIRQDLGKDFPDQKEPFELTGLDRYLVDQELLTLGIGDQMARGLAILRAEGRWPLGTPGEITFSEKSRQIATYLRGVDELRMGQEQPDLPFDLMLGDCRLMGTLDNIHEKGVLLLRFGKLRGRDLLTGWMYHLLAKRLLPEKITRIVALDVAICFNEQSEGPTLSRMLALYLDASSRPLPLLLEPALAYARQDASSKAKTSPMAKALASYRAGMEKGYEPEWALLYGDKAAEEVLGEEFVDLCQEIFCSLWSGINGK